MWLVTFLYISIPFMRLGGKPLLKIDIADGALYAFGGVVPFHDLFPLLLALLAVIFGFLFVAAGFGRLWCGWACPQTILSELAEWVIGRGRSGSAAERFRRHALHLLTAGFFSTITCLYFVDLSAFLPPAFLLHPGWGSGTWLALVLLLYGDMAFMRRTFCIQFCPYGKILTVLSDESGLRVAMDPVRQEQCKRCAACVTVCPMELDVREGPNTECIQCGLCIEACNSRFASAPLDGKAEGIVHFYIGDEEELATPSSGPPPSRGRKDKERDIIIPLRSLIPLAMATALSVAFITVTLSSSDARFQVRRSAQVPVRQTDDGGSAHFFKATVTNRSDKMELYRIVVTDQDSHPVEARGQLKEIELAPAESRQVSFVVVLAAGSGGARELEFSLVNRAGATLQSSTIRQAGF